MSLDKLKKRIQSDSVETYKLGLSGEGSTIVLNNSFSYLENFSDAALEVVEATLTYDNQEVLSLIQQIKIQLGMAYRYRNVKKVAWFKARLEELESQKKVCWLKGNKIPTGHLNLVRDALKTANLEFDVIDLRENYAKKIDYQWTEGAAYPPRQYQIEMVTKGIEEHRGVFESAVGTGKTYIAQMLIHALKVPALIVLPSKDLSVQTADDFRRVFGDVVQLVDTPKKAKTEKPIKICTIHMLTSLYEKGELESFVADIGMICIDEVHHAGAKSYVDLLPYFEHIYYRFGFSGTFLRNDSKTLDMWGFLSTVLMRYSAAQATKDGFLTPLEVQVHKIEGVRGSDYHREYTLNYCENPELLTKIRNIIDSAEDAQVLILVGRKEKSGAVIHEYLNDAGVSNAYISGDSERDIVREALGAFNAKKVRVLIGSSVIGEGIDVRSTDHLIMLLGGKSEIVCTQAIGRAVRLFPGKTRATVHDFQFQGTKYLEKHLAKRLEIYKKNFDGKVKL